MAIVIRDVCDGNMRDSIGGCGRGCFLVLGGKPKGNESKAEKATQQAATTHPPHVGGVQGEQVGGQGGQRHFTRRGTNGEHNARGGSDLCVRPRQSNGGRITGTHAKAENKESPPQDGVARRTIPQQEADGKKTATQRATEKAKGRNIDRHKNREQPRQGKTAPKAGHEVSSAFFRKAQVWILDGKG